MPNEDSASRNEAVNDAKMRKSLSDTSSLGSSIANDSDIHLTILMVSGVRTSLGFKPSDTVLSVKEQLLQNWPKDFDAKPASPTNLRIVYLGHFLDDNDTLEASKLQPGNTTVHLTIKAASAAEKTGKKDIDKAPRFVQTHIQPQVVVQPVTLTQQVQQVDIQTQVIQEQATAVVTTNLHPYVQVVQQNVAHAAPYAAPNNAPYNNAPYNNAPYNNAPYNNAPYNSAPYNSAPYNNAPYNAPHSAPYATPYAAPYATPYAAPYATPYAAPYASAYASA
ncbi:hypothetical protein GGI12_000868 [Dipsacomyces acuminosporus]|nr:hypothetical protein GGI12_000868 [Dipsacomyces acuminosporus]